MEIHKRPKLYHFGRYLVKVKLFCRKCFVPVTGLECSHGKIFIPVTKISVTNTEISVTGPARPLIWTHRYFYKENSGEARSRKPSQPGWPGSYEEAPSGRWLGKEARQSQSCIPRDVWISRIKSCCLSSRCLVTFSDLTGFTSANFQSPGLYAAGSWNFFYVISSKIFSYISRWIYSTKRGKYPGLFNTARITTRERQKVCFYWEEAATSPCVPPCYFPHAISCKLDHAGVHGGSWSSLKVALHEGTCRRDMLLRHKEDYDLQSLENAVAGTSLW